jgi:hypothetical protein
VDRKGHDGARKTPLRFPGVGLAAAGETDPRRGWHASIRPARSNASTAIVIARADPAVSAPGYARSFTLPQEVDEAASNARLDNGVLTLTLTKKAPAQTQRIRVD